MRWVVAIVLLGVVALSSGVIPIIVDTDIGSAMDDTYDLLDHAPLADSDEDGRSASFWRLPRWRSS